MELIQQIVTKEWTMFSQVNNVGGKASCQNDPKTFAIMRTSQFLPWNEATLDSYYRDLLKAEQEGRNVLTEKYGYMMEFTSPEEYEKIKDHFPVVTREKQQLIDQITKIQLDWTVEMGNRYPLTAKQGRPVYRTEDTWYSTSIETYMIGELKTYSEETLKRLLAHLLDLQAKGENMAKMTLEYTATYYGYSSIEQLESALGSKE